MNQAILEGYNSISSCLKSQSRDIYKIFVDESLKARKPRAILPLKTKASKMNIPIEYISAEEIDKLASGKTHGGVIALCGDRKYVSLKELLETYPKGYFVYLDGIEDPFNFGQAIRAIYASGADGVLLSERNWMSASATVARASAGASELIPASIVTKDDIAFLKANGFKIICTDLKDDAVNYTEADLRKPLVLIIGGEKRGISSSLTALCDETVMISYGRDFKQSLGASEAAGILTFEVLKQNKQR